MRSPLDRARTRLEAFRRAEASHRLAELEGRDAAQTAPELAAARRALGTGENRADLDEARSLGLLDPGGDRLIHAHLADVAASEALFRAGISLSISGTTPVLFEGREHALLALAGEAIRGPALRTIPRLRAIAEVVDRDRRGRLEAIASAAEAASRVRARAPVEESDLGPACERFLAATEDTVRELAARARHAIGARGEGPFELVSALASPETPRGRAAKVTELLRPLGLDRALSRGARLGAHRLAATEVAVIARPGAPVSVLEPAVELGLASRSALAAAAMRAVVVSLAPASLPFEARTETETSTLARTIGVACSASLAVPAVLSRSLGESDGDARRDAPRAALGVLLGARLRATQALSIRARPSDEEARVLGARALGLDEPLPSVEPARPSCSTEAEVETAARSTLAGLAVAHALRERFDVDWARNPRVGDVVRAAAAHGAALSGERWLVELGGRLEDAAIFGREIAGG